jgi:hypothetical protein
MNEDSTEVYQKTIGDEKKLLEEYNGQWRPRDGRCSHQIKSIEELVDENEFLTGWCKLGIMFEKDGKRVCKTYYYRRIPENGI